MATTLRLGSMAEFEALKNRDTSKNQQCTKSEIHSFPAARKRQSHVFGEMNKTEERFSEFLEIQRLSGEIVSWAFEAIKLKLADKTYLSPDFLIEKKGGEIIIVDAKAKRKGEHGPHVEDDASVKMKVAAKMFNCFTFYIAWEEGGEWKFRLC